MITISKELQKALQESKERILHLIDPDTHVKYILLPAEDYDQMQTKYYYDDNPISQEEREALLVELGLSMGWDDPEMDVYNELEPHVFQT